MRVYKPKEDWEELRGYIEVKWKEDWWRTNSPEIAQEMEKGEEEAIQRGLLKQMMREQMCGINMVGMSCAVEGWEEEVGETWDEMSGDHMVKELVIQAMKEEE